MISQRLRCSSKVAVVIVDTRTYERDDMSKCHLRLQSVTTYLFRKAHLVMRQLKIAYNGLVLVSREICLMRRSLFSFPVVLFIAVKGNVQGHRRFSFEMGLLII